jgi:hypothetical protein
MSIGFNRTAAWLTGLFCVTALAGEVAHGHDFGSRRTSASAGPVLWPADRLVYMPVDRALAPPFSSSAPAPFYVVVLPCQTTPGIDPLGDTKNCPPFRLRYRWGFQMTIRPSAEGRIVAFPGGDSYLRGW